MDALNNIINYVSETRVYKTVIHGADIIGSVARSALQYTQLIDSDEGSLAGRVTRPLDELEPWLKEIVKDVNENKVSLQELAITFEDLIEIAPHLEYVDTRGLDLTERQWKEFTSSLREVNQLFIVNDIIKELDLSNAQALKLLICSGCSGLTSLDLSKNQALKLLNCSGCSGLTSLDLSKNQALKLLNCSDCLGLTSLDLSKNRALEKLGCSGCLGLKSLDLSKNQALKLLYCFSCSELKSLDLSKNRALEKLDCSGCSGLTSLDLSKNQALKLLYCSDCLGLASLDLSKNQALNELGCSGCSGLKSLDLSNNQALKLLYCFSCSGLTSLDLSKNQALNELGCSGCLGLKSLDLSKNQALNELDCSDCLGLTSLDLSNNPALELLYCFSCSGLTSLDLSNNRALNKLGCSGCEGLTRIIATGDALPLCTRLIGHNCPNLQQIPQLPRQAEVSASLESLRINVEELKRNPKSVLLKLGVVILNGNPFPNIVYFEAGVESLAIDIGGVRQQLIDSLFIALIEDESLFDDDAGIKIPTENVKSEQEIKIYRILGSVMGYCLRSSSVTGVYFEEDFFAALIKYRKEILSDNPPEDFLLKFYNLIKGYDLNTVDSATLGVYKDLFDENRAKALLAMAKEIVPSIKEETPAEMRVKIQGTKVDAAKLKVALEWESPNGADTGKTQRLVEEWIDKNPDKLEKFLIFITSSRVLKGEKIKMEVFAGRDGLPTSHACFDHMELPEYPDYETLDKMLNTAFLANQGFGAA